MSDFFKLLQEADLASLEYERAKMQMEASKDAWERAKEDYDDARKALEKILFKADDMAIPRQRIRKLIDDRAQALMASGLMVVETTKTSRGSKSSKPKNAKAAGKNKADLSQDKNKDSASAELN